MFEACLTTSYIIGKSVREVIFDVGHHALVKEKLRALLASEIVPVCEMQHDGISASKTIDEEGGVVIHKRNDYIVPRHAPSFMLF